MNPLLNLRKSIGFGFMNASWPGSPVLTDEKAREAFLDVLRFALDDGVTFFDTADIYAPSWDAMGHNEILLADAIDGWSGSAEQKQSLVLATKGGITRSEGELWGRNASADYLVRAAERSAKNLRVAVIPVWQHHRLDPSRTFSEALAGLKAVKASGIARHIGVSNYNAKQLRAAFDAVGGPADGGLVSVQNQLNPVYHHDMDVLEICEELGLAYLPWSPMMGARSTESESKSYDILDEIAQAQGVSRFAVASAWLRSLSPNLVVMPGVTKRESVVDSLSGLDFVLSDSDLARLNRELESGPVHHEIISDQPLAD
ncbi:aldo/keto reductase [Rhodoluna limnophila]|uniref:aldo/keto reductase n=1 Tax=Rhodoluna limnophila TaxID=232537 RepID=UPI001106D450|nr:aldo/keto reductase [Rhodoluna limnophila]